jgi:ligand-binding sensor domain-containing protein
MTIDQNGSIWISSSVMSIANVNGEQWSIIDIPSLEPECCVNISDIELDNVGNLWIGLRSFGIAKFDGSDFLFFNNDNSPLPRDGDGHKWNIDYSVAIDKNDIKWIGTWGAGLYRYDNKSWDIYNTSNSSIGGDYISTFEIDSNNWVWMGGAWSQLSHFDGTNWVVHHDPHHDNIGAIATDNNGHVWTVGGDLNIETGLCEYDGSTWTYYDSIHTSIPHDQNISLAIDNNNTKWIGTKRGGLIKFDGKNMENYNFSNSGLPINTVNCIDIDVYGNKWIGTSDGLALFNEDGVVDINDNLNNNVAFPNKITLSQNYPNPFNPSTTIKYDLPKSSDVKIEVYNIAGQKIQTLLNKKIAAGSHEIEFNAENRSSGVYFYRIEAGEFQDVKKMILLK